MLNFINQTVTEYVGLFTGVSSKVINIKKGPKVDVT